MALHPAEPGLPDSAEDSTDRFAADLRALRLAAGNPTLLSLQHATGISKSVISDALRGQQLPSVRTVDRIARALEADPAGWVTRRDALVRRAPAAGAPNDALSEDEALLSPMASVRRSTAIVAVTAAFALGTAVSGGVGYAVASTAVQQAYRDAIEQTRQEILDAPVSPHAQINVANGVDPALSPCVNDAKVATSEMRTNNTKIEIIWSNKCYAGWARVTRYDERISGNTITAAIYPEAAPYGPDRQTATEPNVQGAYTTLVVRPSPQTRLCAVGSITVDGASIDLGEPLCI